MRNKLFMVIVATVAFGLVGCNKEKAVDTAAVNAEPTKEATTTTAPVAPVATPVPAETPAVPAPAAPETK